MRLFVSLPIPTELQKKLSTSANEIAQDGAIPVSFEKIHLTLRFIGEVGSVTTISNRLQDVKFERFNCVVRSLGAFPNQNYVRVVWAGLESKGKLESLSQKINSVLKDFPGDVCLSPHITIARVKKKIDVSAFLKKYQEHIFGEFEVCEFHLMESTLSPSGSKYNIISKYHCDL